MSVLREIISLILLLYDLNSDSKLMSITILLEGSRFYVYPARTEVA